MKTILQLSIILFSLLTPAMAEEQGARPRVVSIGGAVTEIVYALGAEETLVARDSTSTYPPEALALPDAGYMRALSAEGVMAVRPDLILAVDGAGPPEQLQVLRSTGVRIETIPEGYDGEAVVAKIERIGDLLGRSQEAAELARKVRDDLAAAEAENARPEKDRKRVLFVLSLQDGKIRAAGRGTSAEAMIRLAGGVNAVSDIDGFKAVSPEALATARPDVILMMARGSHAATADEVFAHPALALTPAAATRSLVVMDGLHLLSFGPRTAEAVRELARELYGPKT
jgi:iron complex transport system substrate-binding protein